MIGVATGQRGFASAHRAARGSASRGHGEQADPIAVLLVEDNPRDATLCCALLEDARGSEPLEITIAATLGDALARLPGAFELVLLDLHLPDGKGVPAVRRVLAAVGNRPVVVLTGLQDELCARACLEAGAQDYLDKNDMDPRVLRRAVDFARARARASQLTRRLEHADRLVAIGQIAAGVAHEVRTPVTFVQANTDEIVRRIDELRCILDSDLAPPHATTSLLDDLSRLLQDNVEGIGRVARIVREFGAFASSTPDALGLVDPAELCRRSLGLVAPQVRHRALLVSHLAAVPPIEGDARRLGQVIVNLVLNATHAITPDPARRNEVRVETSSANGMVCIAVNDTGCGIPAGVLPRLFDPFYSTKPRTEGTGLGLTISLEIVEAMGGWIDVHSTVGEGSRFEVWLPAAKQPAPTARRPELALVPPHRRVLLIDDEVLLVLGRHHDVLEARGGEAALELLRKGERVDIVLCDLMMSGMDGVQTLEAVRAEFPALAGRFVVLTGGAVTPRTQEFLDSSELPVVGKPVALDTLLRVIDERTQAK
jgi:signal transduction histidine kinase